MEDFDGWLLLSYGLGLTPAVIMLVLYGFRTRFWDSEAGLAIFLMILVIVGTYGISFAALALPQWARSGVGQFTRIIPRYAFSFVLWYLLFAFLRAQRRGRIEAALRASRDASEAGRGRDSAAH